jgi:hypothetical protein
MAEISRIQASGVLCIALIATHPAQNSMVTATSGTGGRWVTDVAQLTALRPITEHRRENYSDPCRMQTTVARGFSAPGGVSKHAAISIN